MGIAGPRALLAPSRGGAGIVDRIVRYITSISTTYMNEKKSASPLPIWVSVH